MLDEVLASVEFLRPRQDRRFGDSRAELLPRHQCSDRVVGILLVVTGGDQRRADARVEADFLIDGPCIRLEGAGMPPLGLAEHGADQPVEQVDGLIGQAGGEVQTDCHQRRVPSLPFIVGDMLDRGAARLAGELCQARLMDKMSSAWRDADTSYMFQPLDDTEHGRRRGGFWHLPQPGQPVLAGLLPAMGQRIKALALFRRQPIGQAPLHFPSGLMTDLDAEPFECRRPRENDPTLPAFFHNQPSQMAKPFVLNGLRQQPCRQLGGGTGPERTKLQSVLQLGGMTSAVPLGDQIFVDRLRKNTDLIGDKREERSRRSLTGAQRTAGITQVAKHQSMTEAVVIATAAPDRREVSV